MVGGRECAGRLPGTRRIGPCNGTVQPLKTNALKRGIRRYAVAEAMQDGDAPHRYRHGVVLHDRCGLTTPERVAARLLDVPPPRHVHCIKRGRKVVDDVLVDTLHRAGVHATPPRA